MRKGKAKAMPPKMITVYGEILQETDDAILVRCDDDADGEWLAKSQIKYSGGRGDIGVEIQIPDWLANEKGFFDGMGYAPAKEPALPAEPAPDPMPEPEHICKTCMQWGGEEVGPDAGECVECSVRDPEEATGDYWRPAIGERRCETCAHNPGVPDLCEEAACLADETAPNWTPIHPCFAPPTDTALTTSPGKRVFGDNVRWIKEESITVSFPLSEAEKARYAEEMATLDKEIEELEDERSETSSRLKKQIDAKEQERREMSAHINDGEPRTFSCDCLKDYNTGEMVWTNAYPPYEEVQRRKMTKEEMQPSLLEFEERPAAGAPDSGVDFDSLSSPSPLDEPFEPEKERSCETCGHYDAVGDGCEASDGTECSTYSDDPAFMAGWAPLSEDDDADSDIVFTGPDIPQSPTTQPQETA